MGRPKPSVAETSYTPSTLPPSHIIVQLGPPRGSSQFTSLDPDHVERLVELNPKLKRSGMLAQRGDFGVVNLYAVDPKAKAGAGKGVEGEVWTEREVKGFKRGGEWYVSSLGSSEGSENGVEGIGEVGVRMDCRVISAQGMQSRKRC
jgi:hypothetical protein